MKFLKLTLFAALILSVTSFSHSSTHNLCNGFVPENDLNIPVDDREAGGITEAQFTEVLDLVTSYYGPVIQAKGGTLLINRRWSDGTVNASAQRSGTTYVLNMYGGLARHPQANRDFFLLVACHELGHHLGGAPKSSGWMGPGWATNEGQSDYFATLRCMRFLMPDAENEEFVKNTVIDPLLATNCETIYPSDSEKNLCKRIGMAGIQGGLFFQALRKETVVPQLATPDPRIVTRTDDAHPATQCRMDTYYQGALCLHNTNIELSESDLTVGTCNLSTGQTIGIRPRCWLKP